MEIIIGDLKENKFIKKKTNLVKNKLPNDTLCKKDSDEVKFCEGS